MRIKHVNKLIFAHLNINSLNKNVKSEIDDLIISETKIVETFPLGQFKINGLIHHFVLITIAALGYYVFCSGR